MVLSGIVYDSEKLFEELFHPVSSETFFAEYAKKKPLRIPGDPGKIERLLGRPFGVDELTSLLDRAQLNPLVDSEDRGISVQLNWYEAARKDTGKNDRDQKSIQLSPGQAGRAIQQRIPGSLSIYFYDSVVFDQSLAEFSFAWLQGMRIIPTEQPVVVFFFRGDVGIGVAPHFDSAEVVQIMITGRKRWRISAQPIVNSPSLAAYRTAEETLAYDNGTPVINPDTGKPWHIDEIDWIEVETGPGDALYLPAGTIHTTENLEPGSLGMSLFVDPLRRVTLVEALTRRFLTSHPDVWIECLPGQLGPNDYEKVSESVPNFVEDGIKEMLHFCREELGPGLLDLVLGGSAQLAVPTDEQTPITPETSLSRTVPFSAIQRTDEGLALHIGSRELTFGEEKEFGFARGIHRTFGAFPAHYAQTWSESGTDYEWEFVEPFLTSLISLGILRIV